MVHPLPEIPRDVEMDHQIPESHIGVKQIPLQKPKAGVPRSHTDERNIAFQLPKLTAFRAVNNTGQIMPSLTQQPMFDLYPRPFRNVPQDPITQHADQRLKPKVYESLIKPMPVDVQLQGTLPPYDVDNIWEEFDWTPPKGQDQERKPLFKHIPDYQIFRAHIPKAAELN